MADKSKAKLDTKAAARILGVSTATIYRLVDRGLLKREKRPFGHVRVVYDAADIEQLRQQVQG